MKKIIIILVALVVVGGVVYYAVGSNLKGSFFRAPRVNSPSVSNKVTPAPLPQQDISVNPGKFLSTITPSITLKATYLTDKNKEITYHEQGAVIKNIKVVAVEKLDPKYKYKMYVVQGKHDTLGLVSMFDDMTIVEEYPFIGGVLSLPGWHSFVLVGYSNGEAKVISKILSAS